MLRTRFIEIDGDGFLNVEMDNIEEQANYLLACMQDFGCEIDKFYWRSKFDETELELFSPRIYNAYNFIADFNGEPIKLMQALDKFEERMETLAFLDKCLNQPFTEEDIKRNASNFLNGLVL